MKKLLCVSSILLLFHAPSFSQESAESKVVFFRTFNFFGGLTSYNVFSGHEKVVKIKSQTFEIIEVSSKPTRFWAKTEVKKHVDINLMPKETYFVRCKAGYGVFLYRPSFETLNVNEFAALVNRKKYLQKQLVKNGYDNLADFVKSITTVEYSLN